MPRKIRQIIQDLKRAGFDLYAGRGSHGNFVHPLGVRMTLSGQEGADAHRYQEKDLREALANLKTKQLEKDE